MQMNICSVKITLVTNVWLQITFACIAKSFQHSSGYSLNQFFFLTSYLINEWNKISEMCSFYIYMNHDFTVYSIPTSDSLHGRKVLSNYQILFTTFSTKLHSSTHNYKPWKKRWMWQNSHLLQIQVTPLSHVDAS